LFVFSSGVSISFVRILIFFYHEFYNSYCKYNFTGISPKALALANYFINESDDILVQVKSDHFNHCALCRQLLAGILAAFFFLNILGVQQAEVLHIIHQLLRHARTMKSIEKRRRKNCSL
jgi:hypothetical protein